jgi:hypothetical protein
VVPDELIGIQFRRISRKKVQLQGATETLDVLRNDMSNVRGMAVKHQKDPAAAAHEMAE